MNKNDPDFRHAIKLDENDNLADYRNLFIINDPDTIYLDGNSLGRLPVDTLSHLQDVLNHQWGDRLIRSWNESWMNLPLRIGAKIARLIGAGEDEVLVTDTTSVNLFKLALAALTADPERTKIVSDVFNFPSDLYILQGIIEILGNRHNLHLAQSQDEISIDMDHLSHLIDADTGLVCLTHVAYKSAFMYDMSYVTQLAHREGALILWDLSHSIGAVPVDLDAADVDLAIGCTYKYLNGGPGSPAFLYVRRDLQEKLKSPIWGWFAAQSPFNFDLQFFPAAGIRRFQSGTPSVLSMASIEPALDVLIRASIHRLRAKSVQQTEILVNLFEQCLAPFGFQLGSPRDPGSRGSHISLRHSEAYRINRAMIEATPPTPRVIPDFREPDNIRLGVAPLYTTFLDIYRAIRRIREIMERQEYNKYSEERLGVT